MAKVLLFDIDDTITYESAFLRKNAPDYLKRLFHKDFPVKNLYANTVCDVFDVEEYLHLVNRDRNLAIKELNNNFWNKNFIKYIFYPIKKDAKGIFDTLRKKGYKVYFASTRGRKTHQYESILSKGIRLVIVPVLTRLQLYINGIKYDGLFLVSSSKEKGEIAKKIKADAVFDDNIEVFSYIGCNVKKYLVLNRYNSRLILPDNINRIKFEIRNFENGI